MPRIRYIKANPLVAAYLGLAGSRRREWDGNFILVSADIMPLGPITDIGRLCAEYGMRVMTTEEMIREQNGIETYPLPEAQNPNFRMPAEAEEAGDGAQEPAETPEATEPAEPEATDPEQTDNPGQPDESDPTGDTDPDESEPAEGADGL